MKNVLHIHGMQKSACISSILVAALLSPQPFGKVKCVLAVHTLYSKTQDTSRPSVQKAK